MLIEKESHHLLRLFNRLSGDEVKQVFFHLLNTIYIRYGDKVHPASQGAFSVVQIRPNDRNCFAFKGAKSWIRWYFRKPAFEDGLADGDELLQLFPTAEVVQGGEIAVNIHNFDDANKVLNYLVSKS
jgi:hypothetical protein